MSLKTGQVITKGPGSWTEVPITNIAFACVEALAKQEGQPLLQDSNLLVEWRPNQPFDKDDEYDDDYEPLVVDSEDDVELEVDDTIDEELADINENTKNDGTVRQGLSQGDLPVTEPVPEHITQPQLEDAEVGTIHEEGVDHMEEEGVGQVEEEGAITDMDEGENGLGNNAAQKSGYNLQSNRSREYSHRFDPQVYNVTNTHVSHTTRKPATIAQNMFGFVFTQMTA